jgi:cytidine deaminase
VSAIDWDGLRAIAESCLPRAYAPYSSFHVAAALQSSDGRIFTGVNVENASYGLTTCAERNAIAAAIVAGAREFTALVVVCSGTEPPAPCGACRQVIAEFPPSFEVRCFGPNSSVLALRSDELLPHAFGPAGWSRSR